MGDSDALPVPDTSRLELLLAGAKAAIQLVPFAGGSLAEMVGYVGQQFIDKQTDKFAESVLRQLEELAMRMDNLPEHLMINDTFYATFVRLADAARRTSDQEKLDALCYAAVNAALPGAPEESLQQRFVQMAESLTPVHILLLKFFLNPREFGVDVEWRDLDALNRPAGKVWDVIQGHVPGLIRRDVLALFVSDLVSQGLLEERNPDGTALPPVTLGVMPPMPDSLAWDFMRFIAPPQLELHDNLHAVQHP